MGRYIKCSQSQIIHRAIREFEDELEIDNDDVMERDEILRTLIRCGLSEYESKVYSSLVFLGVSKAGTISRESKVPQSKIYEVLDQLMNKQLVELFDGRPKEFRAAEPDIALKNLLEKQTSEIDMLKMKVEEMSDYLKPVKPEEVTGGVWTIKGEKFREFFNKTAEMLEKSEKYVYAVTRDFSRSYPMAVAAKECIKRGVKIRVIGLEKLNKKNYYRAIWYRDQGIELRQFEARVHPRIIIADGKQLLLRLDHQPTKRNRFRFNSLWSEDPSLVTVMDIYVKNMWKNSKPINFKKATESTLS